MFLDFAIANLCVLTLSLGRQVQKTGLSSTVMRNASPPNIYSVNHARRILPEGRLGRFQRRLHRWRRAGLPEVLHR